MDDILYAAALSVAAGGGFWEKISSYRPEELFELIDGQSRKTQPYAAAKYPERALDAAEEILNRVEKQGLGITHFWSDDYPAMLREIKRPPIVLYYIGTLPEGRCSAVVGTRTPSAWSVSAAEKISAGLVSEGFTVVSGMARGIDAAAHRAALDSGGRTAGILANGIDVAYPSANRDLYKRISETGGSCLISEYPPGIYSGRWTFVRRNRIISGLCPAVAVIQAGRKSGTLITARYAAEQGRDVYVCPGSVFDESFEGSHRLISQGAAILFNMDEYLSSIKAAEERRIPSLFTVSSFSDDSGETKILNFLADRDADADTVIRECGIPASEFQEALVMLEMEGRIRRKGNTLSLV